MPAVASDDPAPKLQQVGEVLAVAAHAVKDLGIDTPEGALAAAEAMPQGTTMPGTREDWVKPGGALHPLVLAARDPAHSDIELDFRSSVEGLCVAMSKVDPSERIILKGPQHLARIILKTFSAVYRHRHNVHAVPDATKGAVE